MGTDYTIQPTLEKNASETRTIEVDFFAKAAVLWRGNEDWSLNEQIRPTVANGYAYQATTPGTSGANEPRWPKTLAATVADGSVIWTCIAAGANGVNAITSPSAVSDPTGLTISAVSVVETRKIRCTIAGGTLGQEYDAVFSFTLDGQAREARLRVKIRKM